MVILSLRLGVGRAIIGTHFFASRGYSFQFFLPEKYVMHHINLFNLKALPDPDFKYRSYAKAL